MRLLEGFWTSGYFWTTPSLQTEELERGVSIGGGCLASLREGRLVDCHSCRSSVVPVSESGCLKGRRDALGSWRELTGLGMTPRHRPVEIEIASSSRQNPLDDSAIWPELVQVPRIEPTGWRLAKRDGAVQSAGE